jgi:thiol-disulfide isomerase/thioredoxin
MVANPDGRAIREREIETRPARSTSPMMRLRPAEIALVSLLALFPSVAPTGSGPVVSDRAPDFPNVAGDSWINSAPLTLAGLRGRPVLIEFWTFDCVNCLRTVPWMRHISQRFRDRGLAVIAVHTPEFSHEREPANVRAAVERLGIDYPVLLDPQLQYWQALGNQYWPAFYLLDEESRIVATAIGEMHEGTARAEVFEKKIEGLLGSR